MHRKAAARRAFAINCQAWMILLAVTAFSVNSRGMQVPTPAPRQVAPAPKSPSATSVTPPIGSIPVRPPFIESAEAHAGRPYGVAKVTYRLSPGEELIARSGSTLITERDQRISFPVNAMTPLKKFLSNFTRMRQKSAAESRTFWFLFTGEAPLNVTLHGSDQTTFQIPVEFDKPRQYERFVKNWWNGFSEASDSGAADADYPLVAETYLASLVSRRLGLKLPRPKDADGDPLSRMFQMLFDVESLRIDGIKQAMLSGTDPSLATLPVPAPIAWTPLTVTDLPDEVPIEALVQSVPAECFYLRFGTWNNQIWLQRLTEEFGGDLGRMVQLRGYRARIQSKFLTQLAIESSEFDRLFGGTLIDDVGVMGMDAWFDNGAAVGILLHAKNSAALKSNLISKRKKFAAAHKADRASVQDLKIENADVQFLSTPDNRYRSFYVSSGDNHLVTTSRHMVKRFLEASRGKGSLADTAEFRFARFNMPLDRDDTMFVYLSTAFFQQLLTPEFQIELKRRNQVVTDMMLLDMARLTAESEKLDVRDVDDLVKGNYLPEGFGKHADGSELDRKGQHWHCSLRGRRGFFTPVCDMVIDRVTNSEQQWYAQRADFVSQNIRSLDPMLVAVKRYQRKEQVERVVFDARVLPFGEEKYWWLFNRLGDPLAGKVAVAPDDIIRFDASLRSMPKLQGGSGATTHHVFGAVQDYLDPGIDLRPRSFLELLNVARETPGYIGAWPGAGLVDWMPQLGGRPDGFGYTYSRLLKVWRLQWEGFSILSFDQRRLEELKRFLKIVPAERPAHIRLKVGDLASSKIRAWANALNFRRSWQASLANVRLMNMLRQQFAIPVDRVVDTAQRILDVDLVCSLDGEYQQVALSSGRKIWISDAWPTFDAQQLPADYTAPLLTWFRGLELEVLRQPTQFSIHGFLDIQRTGDSEPLPAFELFKGFGSMFGGGGKGTLKAAETKPEESKQEESR